MNMSLKITLNLATLLLFAAAVHFADSASVAFSESSADDDGLASVSAPAYVKELYRNLSKQDSENSDATTIRSIPAIHDGEGNSK